MVGDALMPQGFTVSQKKKKQLRQKNHYYIFRVLCAYMCVWCVCGVYIWSGFGWIGWFEPHIVVFRNWVNLKWEKWYLLKAMFWILFDTQTIKFDLHFHTV